METNGSVTSQNKVLEILSNQSSHKSSFRKSSSTSSKYDNKVIDKQDVDSYYNFDDYSSKLSNENEPTIIHANESSEILTVLALKFQIERLFKLHKSQEISLDILRSSIIDLLKKVDLTTSEINKFTYWDNEKSYTRNLVATDNENYNLLLLCWTPGMESKIHNHPCDTCYMKAIRGSIQETRYKADTVNNKVIETSVKFLNENQGMYFFYHTL